MSLQIYTSWSTKGQILAKTQDIGVYLTDNDFIVVPASKDSSTIIVDLTTDPAPTSRFQIFGVDFYVTGINGQNTIAKGATAAEFATNLRKMLNKHLKVSNKFNMEIVDYTPNAVTIFFEWNEIGHFETGDGFFSDDVSFMQPAGGNRGNLAETQNVDFFYTLIVDAKLIEPNRDILNDYITSEIASETVTHTPLLNAQQDNLLPIYCYFNENVSKQLSIIDIWSWSNAPYVVSVDYVFSRLFKIIGGKGIATLNGFEYLESVESISCRVFNMRLQKNEDINDYNIQSYPTSAKFITSKPKTLVTTRDAFQFLRFDFNFTRGYIEDIINGWGLSGIQLVIKGTVVNAGTWLGYETDLHYLNIRENARTIVIPCGVKNPMPNSGLGNTTSYYEFQVGYVDPIDNTTYYCSELVSYSVCNTVNTFAVYFLSPYGNDDTMIFQDVSEKSINAIRQYAKTETTYSSQIPNVLFGFDNKERVTLRTAPFIATQENQKYLRAFQNAERYLFFDVDNKFRELKIDANETKILVLGESIVLEVSFLVDLF